MATPIATVTMVLTTLGLVLISPLALHWLARIEGVNWSLISEIGQTYGAVSALLSALALGGVAVSVRAQIHETRAAREQVLRQSRMELLRMPIEDPFYFSCWEPPPPGIATVNHWRRQGYINLILSFYGTRHRLGTTSEDHIRHNLALMFRGEPWRQYWEATRSYWATHTPGNGRQSRFRRIIEEEYRKAVAAGPPIPIADYFPDDPSWAALFDSTPLTRYPRQRRRIWVGLAITGAAAGGVLLGAGLRRGN